MSLVVLFRIELDEIMFKLFLVLLIRILLPGVIIFWLRIFIFVVVLLILILFKVFESLIFNSVILVWELIFDVLIDIFLFCFDIVVILEKNNFLLLYIFVMGVLVFVVVIELFFILMLFCWIVIV